MTSVTTNVREQGLAKPRVTRAAESPGLHESCKALHSKQQKSMKAYKGDLARLYPQVWNIVLAIIDWKERGFIFLCVVNSFSVEWPCAHSFRYQSLALCTGKIKGRNEIILKTSWLFSSVTWITLAFLLCSCALTNLISFNC